MNAVIPVEVPEQFRQALTKEKGEAGLPRWALEALLAEAVREGLVTEGYVGRVLGLSFDERERFLSQHGVLHDESVEELREQQSAIERAMRQS